MRKSTVLLAAVLMLFLVAIPSSADKLTLTGEYVNSGVGSQLLEEDGFNNILTPHSLSLNLGYIYKDTEFNIGIKNFDLKYDTSVAERYQVGQSFYIGLDSNNFQFSYLRGDYEKYSFNASDDIIGFNLIYQDLDLPLLSMQDYGIMEFENYYRLNLIHENLFRVGFSIGKLSVVGYYLDSEVALYGFNYFDPYNTAYLTPLYYGSVYSISGPAISANLALSKYLNIGVTYSKFEMNDTWNETLSFNITGKLPILSGEYFAVALKTSYLNIDTSQQEIIESEKFTIYAGIKDLGLRDDSIFKLGLDYAFVDKDAWLYESYDSALGQMGIYKNMMSEEYKDSHRVGITLGINFSKNLKLSVNDGIIFAKNTVNNNTEILGNVTNLDLVYSDIKGNKFSLNVLNDANFMDYVDDTEVVNFENYLNVKALGKVKLGDVVELGIVSRNNYHHETYESSSTASINDFYGSTNVFLVSDLLFDLEKSNSVGIILGGSIGVIYGNLYDGFLEDAGNYWGRINYNVYAGINAKVVEKLGLQFGIYAGTDTYVADALYRGGISSIDDFNWTDVNLVASLTIGYDVSEKTTISLTGTYRNWKYMITADSDDDFAIVNIEDEFGTDVNTKYFVQAKVTFNPTDNVKISLAIGRNGLANEKLIQTSDAMPWDYLKVPVSYNSFNDLWKHVELNVSISF